MVLVPDFVGGADAADVACGHAPFVFLLTDVALAARLRLRTIRRGS